MMLSLSSVVCRGFLSPQTAEAWAGLPYAQSLLDDHACSRTPGACTVNTSDTFTGSGALGYPNVPVGTKRPVACASCGHGSHMVPYLVGLYGVKKVIEVGVCTGASVVSVLRTHGDSIDSYTAVDPWGERRCNPGCGCSSQMRTIAARFPMLKLLQEYSVPGARRIPDGSVDLAFIDATHDYTNVHQDVLAYWSKVKPNGVLAGHDFNHHRNWAGILEKRIEYSKGAAGKRIPPSYGVGMALGELFHHCEIRVRFGVWWIEKRSCPAGPIAIEHNSSAPLWIKTSRTGRLRRVGRRSKAKAKSRA
eukprot:scaffold55292_cov60-Phaeocystis_antarctica.AAC.6